MPSLLDLLVDGGLQVTQKAWALNDNRINGQKVVVRLKRLYAFQWSFVRRTEEAPLFSCHANVYGL